MQGHETLVYALFWLQGFCAGASVMFYAVAVAATKRGRQ